MPPRVEHKLIDNAEHKYCSGCDSWLLLHKFSKHSRNWDKLKPKCKLCINSKQRDRYAKNPKHRMTEDELYESKLKQYVKTKTPVVIKDNIEGKVCSSCDSWKACSDYTSGNKKYVDGSTKYRNECNECRNVRRRTLKKEKKEKREQEALEKERIFLENHEPPPKKNDLTFDIHESLLKINGSKHKYINGQTKKICRYCSSWKLLKHFWSDSNHSDKLTSVCINCSNLKRKLKYEHHRCIAHNKKYFLCYECYPHENIAYRERHRNRRQNNENIRLTSALRHRIYIALKDNYVSENTLNLLGCSLEDLWIHLEKQFSDDMTRKNYGTVWHVDHIKPCAAFNLDDDLEQKRCFNWKNLQPLCARENLNKGAKYKFDIVHEIKLLNIT